MRLRIAQQREHVGAQSRIADRARERLDVRVQRAHVGRALRDPHRVRVAGRERAAVGSGSAMRASAASAIASAPKRERRRDGRDDTEKGRPVE